MTTAELLSEPVDLARSREKTAFASVAGDLAEKIILFGAGNLGKKVAIALKDNGIRPLAFADNSPTLIGTQIDGVIVCGLNEAIKRWGNAAIFVVTIFHPTADAGMKSRLDRLRRSGCDCVIPFLQLLWALGGALPHFGADLPSRILSNAEELKEVSASLTDEHSREVFRRQLSWRLRAVFSMDSTPSFPQYFPSDLIKPCSDELFVDGGAYNGDTVRAMPWPYQFCWAIEPDPLNIVSLENAHLQRSQIYRTALGQVAGAFRFKAEGTMASARSNDGGIEVKVTPLDDIIGDQKITFLKLDIEGDELDALKGGEHLLRRSQPVCAICIYHRVEDLWTIPLWLIRHLPHHKIALRSHAHDGFELVVYAIPESRWKAS